MSEADRELAVPGDEPPCQTPERRTGIGTLADRVLALVRKGRNATPSHQSGPMLEEVAVPYVICVDDDADFSWALKMRLESVGVAVVRAFEGTEGLHTVFRFPASAVILDFEMPNGQGDYILGRLKSNPITRDIPVFIATGRTDKGLERKMLSRGAAEFFTKPLRWDEFMSALGKYVPILRPEGLAAK